jgi:hypothetical protein
MFRPRPQVPAQRFCAAKACQRERKRRWQHARWASDPDYRWNQAQAQQSWGARHPEYWQVYRLGHPEYCERNREQQHERDRRRAQRRLAKMDAWTGESVIPSGTYQLTPVAPGNLAKMDAWMVEISLLSSRFDHSARSCKERT